MLDFAGKLILAPMAGVTDRAFRKLCIEYGADYTVTEMISAKAMTYGDRKTAVLARILKDEAPVAVQIFGSDPEVMAKAAKMLSTGNYPGCASDVLPAAIDINMGCPVRKVVSNGEGSALMKDEKRACEIVSAVKENSAVPVTVKMRSGFDHTCKNALSLALACESAGADAVCVHGRTREDMYAPPADLEIIRQVKSALKIPVIGNGSVFTPRAALEMFEKTGCDAVMIARGALGNPFIFGGVKALLRGEEPETPTMLLRIGTARRHLDLLYEDKGGERCVCEARKHVAWYIKGMPGAPAVRDAVNRALTYTELSGILRDLTEEYEEKDAAAKTPAPENRPKP